MLRNIQRHLRLAAAAVAVLCLFWASPGAAAQSLPPHLSPAVRNLATAVERIKQNYVDPVDEEKLVAGCREGMLDVVNPSKRLQLVQAEPSQSTSVIDQFAKLMLNITRDDPESADQVKFVSACLRGALRELDSKSTYLNEEDFGELLIGSAPAGGIGLELKLGAGFPIVVSTIEGAPAERAGLRVGDTLTAIDSVSTRDQPLANVVKQLRGAVGSNVTLAITRKQDEPQPLTYTLTREAIRIQSVRWKMLAPGYAYLRIVQFQEATGPLVAQALESAHRENQGELKGLVLDLRGNQGGLLNACVAVAAIFVPRGSVIASTDGRSEDSKMRLVASPEYYLRGRLQTDYIGKLPLAVKTVPMAVLVDEVTAAGSEIVAAALRDHKRAKILGARTFGQGTIATILPLGNKTALKITTARVLGPNGGNVAPVVPDVLLEKSGILARSYGSADDTQLTQALKILGEQ